MAGAESKTTETPLERVLARLQGVRRSGDQYTARCPSHDDRVPSLSVREGNDGRVLLRDHGGCDVEAIVSALGLEVRDLFPVTAAAGVNRRPGLSPRQQVADRRERLREELRDIAAERLAITRAGASAAGEPTRDRLAVLAARETAIEAELVDEVTP